MRYWLTFVLLLSFSLLWGASPSADRFQYNREKVDQALHEMDELETAYQREGGFTYQEAQHNHPLLLQRAQLSYSVKKGVVPLFDFPGDLDWGAFAWGFCCCPVGLFTVATKDDKSDNEKISYWIGVATFLFFIVPSSYIYALNQDS